MRSPQQKIWAAQVLAARQADLLARALAEQDHMTATVAHYYAADPVRPTCWQRIQTDDQETVDDK